MQTLTKTLLALALGLGFLILDANAKPTLAFLGLGRGTDPQIRKSLAGRIQSVLSADTGLIVSAPEDIANLFIKGFLIEPEINGVDIPRLETSLAVRYYAFGNLEPISVVSKRVWWKPWSLKVKWSQEMHLRVLDSTTRTAIFDGRVSSEIAEKAFWMPPDPWDQLSPLVQHGYLLKMQNLLSVQSAKALANAVIEKPPSVPGDGTAPTVPKPAPAP